MAGKTVRVTPELLNKKANAFELQLCGIEKELYQITQQICASRSYWEGEAYRAHERRIRILEEELIRVIGEMKFYAGVLRMIAAVYGKTEGEVVGS